MSSGTTVALIVAAGHGARSGQALAKQFARVGGRPMIAHSHAALVAHPAIDRVVVVIGAGQQRLLEDALGDVEWVEGGATRRDSVLQGLEYLAGGDAVRVLIHDAARPFVPGTVVDRLAAALDSAEGAVPVLPVADTLARGLEPSPSPFVSSEVEKRSHASSSRFSTSLETNGMSLGETVYRNALYRIQTPQAFRFPTILEAHRAWPAEVQATDDAQIARASGHDVILVEGDKMLEKLTYPSDFAEVESRFAATPEYRTASGYDVHRLAAGEELWLGGVRIPHDKGLAGHSDADVALHAITDALLGTIAAGDIGTHFPPSDPQWRGADSAQFLQHAASLVENEGGRVTFIDLTLICEAPKIGPHREAMRARIGDLLRLPTLRVSIKATTTERLGFTGRGEGIAAQAVATVRFSGVSSI
ncbi:bifunctional 2-C-methyl-D-erythritol 4-phosphate cytidylyltransferase/2-C-methyl-D-erythritol 2,4-cyclodiphosphate synthase [Sphingomonas sp. AX6]|uniref:bifunctional 2-C-methyl-D-erythritol 4-phosphate cytidylyltransferase/2-C-methyl-D-erythritol 2,4-cyclodiphosphate synthase n=1 Tax=Sphingomonas sp. AX6 TaxID=2653171 RepID=UPI0012F03C90|nr:bifunctional 2-C-methyl-D-erythritol 4-phosphate cytidylyltransferase/2-C-methyl-D-erythritol 2,4-cyclodiphosphate synthase [Sphingomonas sp. AX6]VXC96570.1 2-C-methyl-D-erythritol 4-phosphate cytidylyltransferase / 2-C-methyl-D-erythritol 2,4-cyclodiphosphate synthase [Sphingomonas sp. AX6]